MHTPAVHLYGLWCCGPLVQSKVGCRILTRSKQEQVALRIPSTHYPPAMSSARQHPASVNHSTDPESISEPGSEEYSTVLSGIRCFPSHVAIIMDGNRRWARRELAEKGTQFTALYGHEAGYVTLKNLMSFIVKVPQIKTLTVYAFSTENWKRQQTEVSGILSLATRVFVENLDDFHSRNCRVRIIGSRTNLPADLCNAVDSAEARTANNTGLLVVVALNYGGHWDISEGFKRFAEHNGQGCTDSLNVESFLPSSFLPPVDLLIRTGGEQRLSNFLPWQAAYAELYFVDTLWPDFTDKDFIHALRVFDSRTRRFGADAPTSANGAGKGHNVPHHHPNNSQTHSSSISAPTR